MKEKIDFKLENERLILRYFNENDIKALYFLLKDEKVNTFLPWFALKNITEAKRFYKQKIKNQKYFFAICLKSDNYPIGYINIDTNDGYELGYALCEKFWNQGIATQASQMLLKFLKNENIPYITATHDENNPSSGKIMQKIGMKYCYSYQEQ
ncbi:GNAT family N-acetyltransferase [Campylobacter sp. US33a]|nr:GNAT family N-acetyltransferase [Campylobacter sp. US33a]